MKLTNWPLRCGSVLIFGLGLYMLDVGLHLSIGIEHMSSLHDWIKIFNDRKFEISRRIILNFEIKGIPNCILSLSIVTFESMHAILNFQSFPVGHSTALCGELQGAAGCCRVLQALQGAT